MVDVASARRPLDGAVFRLASKLPQGSFVKVAPRLYVSSPEACFVQLASRLTDVEAILLGCELCGSYSLAVDDARGFRMRPPLTDYAQLSEYVDLSFGCRGARRASRIVRLVAEGSASPMETILFALMCLPASKGGYGLPFPTLNYRIEVGGSEKKLADRKYYACDFFWPKAKLALEYDSDMFHTGAERITSDSKRRNALESMGIRVVSVTKAQVYDRDELEKIVSIVSKGLRIYRGSNAKDAEEKRKELHLALLGRRSRMKGPKTIGFGDFCL